MWSQIINSKGRYDGAFDAIQMADNLILVAGYSQAEKNSQLDFDNFAVYILDSEGNVVCKREWGGRDNDDLYSIVKVDDENVAITGFKNAVSWPLKDVPGNSDVYLLMLKIKSTMKGENR